MRKLALLVLAVLILAAPLADAQQIRSVSAEIHMASGWTLVGTLDVWRGAVVEGEWTYLFGVGLVGGRAEIQARFSVPVTLVLADGTVIENVTLPELAQHAELLGARVRVTGDDGADGAMIVRGITLLD